MKLSCLADFLTCIILYNNLIPISYVSIPA